jgi:hypothetical protein
MVMQMKYAIIENNRVVNVAESDHPLHENWHQFDIANIGDHFENGILTPYDPYTDPEYLAALEKAIRGERNIKLSATDWTQASDIPTETKEKWVVYRQALRDVPQQEGFPVNVVWPDQPSE